MIQEVILMTTSDIIRGLFLTSLLFFATYLCYLIYHKILAFHTEGKKRLEKYNSSNYIPNNVIPFPTANPQLFHKNTQNENKTRL